MPESLSNSLPPSRFRDAFSKSSISWSIFIIVAFIFTLSGWVPWRVEYPPGTLDTSWILALKWAHLHSIDFGTSFVFTYGPWGYTLEGYEPTTFRQLVAVWSFFAAAFFFGLIVLHRTSHRPDWIGAIWIVLVTMLLGSVVIQIQDVRLFALSWMLLLVHFFAKDKWAPLCKIILLIAVALAGLVKFTMTLMAVGIVGIITLHQIREIYFAASIPKNPARYFAPWKDALIFCLAYIAFWLIARQPLTSLPQYLSHSMELSTSYAGVEELYAGNETSTVTCFLLCAIPLLVLVVLAHWRQWSAATFASIGIAYCIFVTFKAGFVRHDMHELLATVAIAVLAVLLIFVLWKSLRWPGKSLACLILAGSLGISWHTYSQYDSASLPTELWRSISQFPARSKTALTWLAGDCNMRPSYDLELKTIRADKSEVPDLPGPVDIYPWNIAMILSRNLDYRPRPVIQSYLAATPALSQLNAQHLRSSQAPDWLYLDFTSIDGRYPPMDDALSWPELLTLYDLKDLSADMTLFQRTAQPRPYQIVPGAEQSANIGDDIPIPQSDDLIWARIDIRQTAVGKLKEAIYKATPIEMYVETANGSREQLRLLPDVARAGFLLSPHVRDRNEFALLESREWLTQLQARIVTDIRIISTGKTGLRASYDPTIHYSFDRLIFPHLDLSAVPGVSPYVGLRFLLEHSWIIGIEAPAKPMRISSGRFGYRVIGRSQIMVAPTSPPSTAHLGFGMLDQSYLSDPKTAGVQFALYAVKADGAGTVIWTHLLDPAVNPQDRGFQSADVPLPPGTTRVVLETAPIQDGLANQCYWSEATFH